jgi:hypothetical protein
MIEETGTLDDARKQALGEALKRYIQTVMPAAAPEKSPAKP